MLKIIDNFLNKSYHKELLELMNSWDFPWYYNSNISYESGRAPGDMEQRLYETGFSHVFFDLLLIEDLVELVLPKTAAHRVKRGIGRVVVLTFKRVDFFEHVQQEEEDDGGALLVPGRLEVVAAPRKTEVQDASIN